MASVFFNIKITWPTVTNDIRISVYDASDLGTPLQWQQKNAPHLDQQYSFPGLPRVNFVYILEEYSINGNTFISTLGKANFVPVNDELEYKDPVLIQVGSSTIPGSEGVDIPASTIETNYTGNPTATSWAFTLKGDLRPGAIVQVNFNDDHQDGFQDYSVTSTVLDGWDLSDLVADLLAKIVAINPNALAYTDGDGYTGVRDRGATGASGSVTITNTAATSGAQVWTPGVNNLIIPDWIGWDFEIYGRVGYFPNKDDGIFEVDSSWDAATGKLQLLQDGDNFNDGEYWYFVFRPRILESSGGIPPVVGGGGGFSDILVVTTNTTLTSDDIGKKILIIPSGNYLEITMPALTGVEANKITYFEMQGGTAKCALIKPASGEDINWFNGNNLYICPSETIELYKRVISDGVYEWRTQNESGNFYTVGELVFNDNYEGNGISCSGQNANYQQYARLYDWVTRNSSALTYAAWNSANVFSRIKFSLKDTASTNFRIADLNTTPTYLRPKGSNAVGDYIAAQLLEHQHASSSNTSTSKTVTAWGYYHAQVAHIGKFTGESTYYPDMTSRAFKFSTALNMWLPVDGNDNNPNTRVSNIYVKF